MNALRVGTTKPKKKPRRSGSSLTPKAMLAELQKRAEGAEPSKPMHWIRGAGEKHGHPDVLDEGQSYCFDCCMKKVAEMREQRPDKVEEFGIAVDGDYGTECDGLRFCETCGVRLECNLTEHGLGEEVEAYESIPTWTAPPEPGDWAILISTSDNVARVPEDVAIDEQKDLPPKLIPSVYGGRSLVNDNRHQNLALRFWRAVAKALETHS